MSVLVTGKVRFSYANVFEPRKTLSGEEKYSLTILIPKSDNDTKVRIDAEINRILQENVADKFKGVMPANPKIPIHDGDGLKQTGEPYGPECKNCWVMNLTSNSAPEVVDAQVQPIISKDEFYSGCYGRVSLRFYAYNFNGNKGIGCGLVNVQKLEDGQPLDGRTTAAEDFGTPIQQSQYQTPVQPQQMVQPQQNMAQPAIDPITGMPLQPTVNNIYGVN